MVCWTGLALVSTSLAQEYQSAAEEAVEYQRFPWQETGEFQELDRDEPGEATSKARELLPTRQPSSSSSGFNLPTGWYYFFNSLLWVVFVVAVVAAAILVIWMFLKMDKRTSNIQSFEDYAEEELIEERIKQLPFDLQRDLPGNLSEQARQLAQQGNYNRAMMFLFSHVLLALDKRELLKLKKGKTNRQYLREIRQHGDIAKYYRQVMVPFEDSFFGNHDISQTRFENCWDELEPFETVVNNVELVVTP